MALQAAPLAAQATFYVDAKSGDDSDDGLTEDTAFRRITRGAEAANAEPSGAVVIVKGPTCGQPISGVIPYTDESVGGLPGEAFPIPIESGVTIKGSGGGTVYVWSIHASSTAPLFSINDANGPNTGSSLERMNLYSGGAGVEIRATNGHAVETTVRKILFSRNKKGVTVLAEDESSVTVDILTCKITDSVPLLAYPPDPDCPQFQGPALTVMEKGVELEARQTGSLGSVPGAIVAFVQNLTCAGLFQRPANPEKLSALISLDVIGNGNKQHEPAFDRIARIDLDVDSGAWDGGANSSLAEFGWDYGILAKARFDESYSGAALHDYSARFAINVSGTDVHDFRSTGIAALLADEFELDLGAGGDLRGQVTLNSGTKVRRTGSHFGGSTLPADEKIGTGVYLSAGEGYLTLEAGGSEASPVEVSENWRDGIRGNAQATDPNVDDAIWPNGVYFGIDTAVIGLNKRHGLYGSASAGSIGSTWHHRDLCRVVTTTPENHPGSGDTELVWGQGYLNRSSVHNNGGNGVYLAFSGQSHAGLRVVNNIIWNNSYGILYAGAADQVLFAPMAHCTVVGNETFYNMEVTGGPTTRWKTDPTCMWTEDLGTGIYSSIFERQVSTGFDFGPGLEDILEVDSLPRNSDTAIYANALRVVFEDLPPLGWGDPGNENTDDATPFAGLPIAWGSADPAQFFLDGQGANLDEFQDAAWVDGYGDTRVEGEAAADFSDDQRPSAFGDRDKGAEEL